MKKNGKQHEKTKHGVFGDLVSKYKNASQAVEVMQEIPKSIPKRGRPCKAVEKKKAPTKHATKKLKKAHSDDEDDEENAKIDISKILLDWVLISGSFRFSFKIQKQKKYSIQSG